VGIHIEALDLANQLAATGDWPEGLLEARLEEGEGYGDLLVRFGLGLSPENQDLMNRTPAVVAETIINTFRSGAAHGARVRAAWMPGAEYEVSVAHVGGEVFLLVRSPAPGDTFLS
jgi:hypothetical protein